MTLDALLLEPGVTIFSVDFRDGVSDFTAILYMLPLGLEVVENFYDSEPPRPSYLVATRKEPFGVAEQLGKSPVVSGVYSNITGHVMVAEPALSYAAFNRGSDGYTLQHGLYVKKTSPL